MLTLSTKQLGLITMTSLAALIIGTGATWAQVKNPELEALKQVVEELRRRDAEKEKRLEELQRQIEAMRPQLPEAEKPATPALALEKALKEIEAPAPEPVTTDLFSRQAGGTTFRLIDISLDALFAAGTSTKREDSIRRLQGGDHDRASAALQFRTLSCH